MNLYFNYGEKETEFLKSKCPAMASAINKYGILKRKIVPDPFEALLQSVVSQQISGKAAETIWGRFRNAVPDLIPEAILNAEAGLLRSCGISERKASYICGIAEAYYSGNIRFNELDKLADSQIIEKLVALKGVGVWTAEMLLIFSLGRKNILSGGDLGIKKGLCKLHRLPEILPEKIAVFRELYSPYCSIASFYLWETAAE